MTQDIFVVHAEIVDANGAFASLSGYPKAFKSTTYDNDIGKARQRALGDYYDTMGAFGKRDDRKIQIAFVVQLSNGSIIANGQFGKLPELPDPEPPVPPEPDEE